MPKQFENILLRNLQSIYRRLRYGYWEPKSTPLEPLLSKVAQKIGKANILEIGANDGQTNDAIYPIIDKGLYNKAVLVEPIPFIFSSLQKTYQNKKNVELINAAVSEVDGEITIFTVDSNKTTFTSRLSSLNRKHFEQFVSIDPNIMDALIELKVPTYNFNFFASKFNYEPIDIIYIDTEGYDYKILKQIDLIKHKVSLVWIEYNHLPLSEMVLALKQFSKSGFKVYQFERDFLAIHRSLQF